ncbi:protein arginine N-methyltransferase 7 [Octopus sinensis]|uniref:Protein arginine N-methyltransferase n=1 Tax=Octopus sinensis TaxID=2607531 RepID=A0A6P7SH22_9MOLL|nr:protein arginine N-methyltransferase 7 [Octopus sinensis]
MLKSVLTAFQLRSTMSIFVSQFNPLLGKNEWVLQDENYDYHQEIARSSYADMLHDTERNQKYFKALKKAIEQRRTMNEQVNVLDIGTGTGLLSMMAAKCGADSITACEAFTPMAECAKKVIKRNGFEDKIKLIPKRSTELTVGEGKDMLQKANILVTEVFDTELIGEGALSTYYHALQYLLEPNCSVVPHSARVYVQLAQCPLGKNWNEVQPITIDKTKSISVPKEMHNCSGALHLHDLQLNQLHQSKFQLITDPITVFCFDFSDKEKLVTDKNLNSAEPFNAKSLAHITANSSGTIDTLFMWWDLDMDKEGEILLSCAPYWAHPERKEVQWRDHWMQAIYYPSKYIAVEAGEEVSLTSCHDEYSWWFDVSTKKEPQVSISDVLPVCSCGIHLTYGRNRLGMLNDSVRNQVYVNELKKVINKDTVCLSIGDGSLIPLIAAKLGAKKVFAVETHKHNYQIIESFIKSNNAEGVITLLDKIPTKQQFDLMKVDIAIGEPSFNSCLLPWHNLHFWYILSELSSTLTCYPNKMKIFGMAMQFRDLSKIRSAVKTCEGFCLEEFDSMIEDSSLRVDRNIEAEVLWEYPGKALSEPLEIASFDLSSIFEENKVYNEHTLTFTRNGTCNGIAFWVEFQYGTTTISTGIINSEEKTSDGYVTWDKHTRQGVHLLNQPIDATSNGKFPVTLTYHPKSGQINIEF